MTNRNRNRLAMIGLDAAPLSFIESRLGELPTLRQAFDKGRLHRLRTTANLLHASVWPSFYTGKTPGEHGMYFPLQWDPATMRMRHISADWLYAEPFWYEMERRGRRVVTLDVPMTLAARLKNGIEVTNWGTHDQLEPLIINPPALGPEIKRHFGEHPMGVDVPVKRRRRELLHIRDSLVAGAARKGELASWLWRRQDWDFSVTVFGECHRAGHVLWPEDGRDDSLIPPDAMLDVYKAVDRALGQLLAELEKERVPTIIFALHGMWANRSQEHFLPKIVDLFNGRIDGRIDAKRGDARLNRGEGAPTHRNLMRDLRERLPDRLQYAIARVVPLRVRDLVVNRAMKGAFDWEQTQVLPLMSGLQGLLRFNLRGRERDGTIDPEGAEVRQLGDRLEAVFGRLRIAGSEDPLVEDLRRPQLEMPGKRSHLLPDLVVNWGSAAPAKAIVSDHLGTIEAKHITGRSGNHRPEAFCLLLPADGAPEFDEAPAHILDLAPLALRRVAEVTASDLT